jgi:hypothetical protein
MEERDPDDRWRLTKSEQKRIQDTLALGIVIIFVAIVAAVVITYVTMMSAIY